MIFVSFLERRRMKVGEIRTGRRSVFRYQLFASLEIIIFSVQITSVPRDETSGTPGFLYMDKLQL